MQHLQGKRQEIVNFMTLTPRGGNFGVKSVKLIYFFKNLLLFSGAWFRQTKYVVMINKVGSTKIVNSTTPGARVLVLGRDYISHLVKSIISLKIFVFTPRHISNKLSIWL